MVLEAAALMPVFRALFSLLATAIILLGAPFCLAAMARNLCTSAESLEAASRALLVVLFPTLCTYVFATCLAMALFTW